MKAASLAQIRKELNDKTNDELVALCLRLGRFKKDNKELLTYLLFEAQDESGYIQLLKEEVEDLMSEINTSNLYWTKKGLQKIVRFLNKSLRYSGNKQTEVDVRLYFCQRIKATGIAIHKHTTIHNLYLREVRRIEKALTSLHEDLQADYKVELSDL